MNSCSSRHLPSCEWLKDECEPRGMAWSTHSERKDEGLIWGRDVWVNRAGQCGRNLQEGWNVWRCEPGRSRGPKELVRRGWGRSGDDTVETGSFLTLEARVPPHISKLFWLWWRRETPEPPAENPVWGPFLLCFSWRVALLQWRCRSSLTVTRDMVHLPAGKSSF